jgi:hypothetical protein
MPRLRDPGEAKEDPGRMPVSGQQSTGWPSTVPPATRSITPRQRQASAVFHIDAPLKR